MSNQIKYYSLNSLPTSAEIGAIYYLGNGSQYIGTSSNTFLPISDFIFTDTMPSIGILDKIYVHKEADKTSLKIWSGTSFELLSGSEYDDSAILQAISTLQSELSTLKGKVTTVESKATSNEGKITTLTTKTNDIESEVTILDGKVTDLEAELALKGNVKSINGNVADENGNVSITLGSASLLDTGIKEGQIPLLKTGGKLDISVIPDEISVTSSVVSVNGKTGVVELTKADFELSSVDDTSDLDKPISIATQTALDLGLNKLKPYISERNVIFGEEYLSHFHKRLMEGESNVITFTGDSTTSGMGVDSGFKLNELMSDILKKHGFNNISTVNRGVSGASVQQWLDTHLTLDLATNPNVLIIRWGLNSLVEGESLITQLRQGLLRIRTAHDVSQLTIVLMSPNSTNDNPNNRGIVQHEFVNEGIRALAREFQCVFIDTFSLFKDSGNAGDWMDNPYGDGRHIHPLNVMNMWIISKIFDILIPSAIISKYGEINGGRNFETNPLNLNNESNGILAKNRYEKQTASETPFIDTSGGLISINTQDAINELFQYANNGKNSIASAIGVNQSNTFGNLASIIKNGKELLSDAISTKGVPVSDTDSFTNMANKIHLIPSVNVEVGLKKTSRLNILAPNAIEVTLMESLPLSDITATLIEFTQGEQGVVQYEVDFNNNDEANFEYNEHLIYDGAMKLRSVYILDMINNSEWTDVGFLHEINIVSSDWVSINKLNVVGDDK